MKRKSLLIIFTLLPFFGLALQASGEARNTNANYVIHSSDLILFRVFQEPDLEQQFRVPQDGEHQFPLIGAVNLRNRTVSEVERELRERYDRDFLVNPQLNLHVVEYAQRRISVEGYVHSPGTIVFPPEEEMTVTQALARAGGVTPHGHPREVRISRVGADGQRFQFSVNRDAIRNGREEDIRLEKDDIITVPQRII